MGYFSCNSCGETLKKNAVSKHRPNCLSAGGVSCLDCNKIFQPDNYMMHANCITEAEKVGGVGYIGKENKGKKKQEQWIDSIRNIVSTNKNIEPRLMDSLQKIIIYGNIPRKQTKFMNFMRSSYCTTQKDSSTIWMIINAHFTEKEKKYPETLKQREVHAEKETVNCKENGKGQAEDSHQEKTTVEAKIKKGNDREVGKEKRKELSHCQGELTKCREKKSMKTENIFTETRFDNASQIVIESEKREDKHEPTKNKKKRKREREGEDEFKQKTSNPNQGENEPLNAKKKKKKIKGEKDCPFEGQNNYLEPNEKECVLVKKNKRAKEDSKVTPEEKTTGIILIEKEPMKKSNKKKRKVREEESVNGVVIQDEHEKKEVEKLTTPEENMNGVISIESELAKPKKKKKKDREDGASKENTFNVSQIEIKPTNAKREKYNGEAATGTTTVIVMNKTKVFATDDTSSSSLKCLNGEAEGVNIEFKWKNSIKKALKNSPSNKLKLSKLEKVVVKEYLEAEHMSKEDKGVAKDLFRKKIISDKFVIENDYVTLK